MFAFSTTFESLVSSAFLYKFKLNFNRLQFGSKKYLNGIHTNLSQAVQNEKPMWRIKYEFLNEQLDDSFTQFVFLFIYFRYFIIFHWFNSSYFFIVMLFICLPASDFVN